MVKCKFEYFYRGQKWKCPLEALPDEDYCYWHVGKNGKKLDDKKLKELRENVILAAYLEDADLKYADLQEVCLIHANLKNADLRMANLQGVNLEAAELQGADLRLTDLQDAYLEGANIQGANLLKVNIQGANFSWANLQGANMYYTIVDSKTRLDNAKLICTNLYESYIDETKSFRRAIFGIEHEINKIVAESLKNNSNLIVLNFKIIKSVDPEIALKLSRNELVKYVLEGDKIVLFDKKKKCVVKIPKREKRFKFIKKNSEENDIFKYYAKVDELNHLLDKNGIDKFLYGNIIKNSKNENLIRNDKDKRIKELKRRLYEDSYEVHSKLYNFYIQNGMIDTALETHYRLCEVRRKRLMCGSFKDKIKAILYDLLILKILTGYGIKIERPLIASALTIILFSIFFWITKGIVKVVNGKEVEPDFFDYLYHSIITFTSLGYANIQPNLNGHIPQALAAVESILGVLMTALLLFTITYRISK